MALPGIPEAVNDFNCYFNGNKLIGTTGEISIPDFEHMTATVSGNGILGEFDAPITGHYSPFEQEVPFRTTNEDFFKLIDPTKSIPLTLRGAIQLVNPSTHDQFEVGMRIVMRGRCIKFTPGTFKQREPMESSITLGPTFYLIELDGKERVQLDKLNGVFRINGVDKLANIRRLI